MPYRKKVYRSLSEPLVFVWVWLRESAQLMPYCSRTQIGNFWFSLNSLVLCQVFGVIYFYQTRNSDSARCVVARLEAATVMHYERLLPVRYSLKWNIFIIWLTEVFLRSLRTVITSTTNVELINLRLPERNGTVFRSWETRKMSHIDIVFVVTAGTARNDDDYLSSVSYCLCKGVTRNIVRTSAIVPHGVGHSFTFVVKPHQ